MMRSLSALLIFLSVTSFLIAEDSPPRSLDDRLEITLFAEDPLLNTPTGIDVDHKGRVWVIESNTHFPPEGYNGHPTDRLLILEDTDGDGKAEAKMFVDGFTHSMSVAVRPIWLDPISFSKEDKPEELKKRTQIYLATRREILLLEDTDGDNQCDKQTRLVHLETEGNYPHNGLAGFAFDGLGNMYFGFGENLGADYKIIGRDGTTYSGGGEGGNIYQVQPDGTKLKHWATGFWNPHANCVNAFGQLFSVDNDPDSLPPCRLLHIIEGGDYGYRFRNGRKGLHPFTAWNGEIPGTLPMVAGTGEAPSGILAYEHSAFPEEYLGNLIVTSWGDHRIDRFQLKRKGASFESVAEPFIVGGENFRPVGIALAPDGSLYVSDWVLRDYKIHGKGRVWRIRAKKTHEKEVTRDNKDSPDSIEILAQEMRSLSLPIRRNAALKIAQKDDGLAELMRFTKERKHTEPLRARFEAYWALQRSARDFNTAKKIQMLNSVIPYVDDGPIDELYAYHYWYAYSFNSDEPAPRRAAANAVASGDVTYSEEPINYALLAARISHGSMRHIDGPVWTEKRMDKYSDDPFVFRLKSRQFSNVDGPESYKKWWIEYGPPNDLGRLAITLGQRMRDPQDTSLLELQLQDSSVQVKRAAVQWVAEEHLVGFRPQVAALFNDPDLTPDLFLATLAALEMLDGKSPQEFDKTPPGKYVLPILKDETKPANVRAIALQLIDPDDDELPAELVAKLMNSENERLKTEAIRTAASSTKPELAEPLVELALDLTQPDELRAEATVGIARQLPKDPILKNVLELIWKSDKPLTAREAFRVNRKPTKEQPTEPFELEEKPNAAAGRRLFFHPNGPGCYKCHTIQGRGGEIGPNLTTIGAAMSREKLIESIRKPSQEVAPQFTTWTMISTKGKTYTGMIVHENQGDTVLGLQDGTTIQLKTADVEERLPQKTSVMPEKLEQQMTEREFEDLVAYLESIK